jgi:hypothetical protein
MQAISNCSVFDWTAIWLDPGNSRIICSCMASCVWRLLSLPLSWCPVSVLLLVCLAPPPNWVWHS